MVYTPKYGDLAPGRIGNGTIEYDALAGGGPAKTAFASEPDGSFVNTKSERWLEGNPVLATSYAVLALQEARKEQEFCAAAADHHVSRIRDFGRRADDRLLLCRMHQ